MALSRHSFLSETEAEAPHHEDDPLLEIKHLHRQIDERAEWFKRHKRKEVITNEGDTEHPCDLFPGS